MNPITAWWEQICIPLDGLLWKKGINHGVIRPMLRNQILIGGALILLGGLCYIIWPWLFWAACGFIFMSFIFLSWSRFFLSSNDNWGNSGLMKIIVPFLLRLLFFGVLLYFCMRYMDASIIAIIIGFAAAAFMGLFSYAFYMRKGE